MSIFNKIRPFYHLNHFRYTFSSGQRILLYLTVTLNSGFLDCKHSCDQIDSDKKGKLVFEDESHKYVCCQSGLNEHIKSHYYHDSWMIRFNQSCPIGNGKFEKFFTHKVVSRSNFAIGVLIHMFAYFHGITPKFQFKFYGTDVSTFNINTNGKRLISFEVKYLLSFVYSHFISRIKVVLIPSENQFHAFSNIQNFNRYLFLFKL